MSSALLPSLGGTQAIWTCLNARVEDHILPNQDELGLLDVSGIVIRCSDQSGAPPVPIAKVELPETLDVENWLATRPSGTPSPPLASELRLLFGHQVVAGDMLRPPADAVATRFSRANLSQHFGIPPIAIEQASRGECWTWDFPDFLNIGTSRIFRGFSTTSYSAIWSYDAYMKTTLAFVVFFRYHQSFETRLLHDLSQLCELAGQPYMLPFALTNTTVHIISRNLFRHTEQGEMAEARLNKHPGRGDTNELFFGATSRASSVSNFQRELRVVVQLITVSPQFKKERLACVTDSEWTRSETDARHLEAGMRYLQKLAEAMLKDTERVLEQTTRQLSIVLNMIAQHQQDIGIELAEASRKLAEDNRRDQAISIEIAKSSKIIAEESKRDSASMKTLAAVTMVYLPGTSVAAVLALPLFDWEAGRGGVVNPRIWVYFCVTIPLTILTIAVWRLWFAIRARQSVKEAGQVTESFGTQLRKMLGP